MPTADNSQTVQTARRKQKILGESSSSSLTFRDYSFFQQQTLGNVRFIYQTPRGFVEDIPCGCPTVSAPNPVSISVSVSSLTVAPESKRDIVLSGSSSIDAFIAKYSPTGNVLWAARIDGTGGEQGRGIATDANNNIVVTGQYGSNPVFIYDASGVAVQTLDWSGSSDTFIAKYSPTGNVLWAARISGIGQDIGNGIATDANNNIVVTGQYSSKPVTIYDASGDAVQALDNAGSNTNDAFIAKYSPAGNVLWAARIGGTSRDQGHGIVTDANNNIVVTGNYGSNPVTIYDASNNAVQTLDWSGSDDIFIATYSPTGNVLWAARISGTGSDFGRGIATDANNNIVVTGQYSSKPITIYDAAGDAVQALDNAGSNTNDAFIAKYSPAGNVLWTARIGGTSSDIGNGIATDANNNIIISGTYSSNPVTIYDASGDAVQTLDWSGSDDAFIATYSPTGNVLWAVRISGIGQDIGNGIATDANNNIVVTGNYGSNPVTIYDASNNAVQTLDWSGSSGSFDTFIAKYSPTGNVLWAARIDGTGSDFGRVIATDANNNIVVSGSYSSNPLTVYYAR